MFLRHRLSKVFDIWLESRLQGGHFKPIIWLGKSLVKEKSSVEFGECEICCQKTVKNTHFWRGAFFGKNSNGEAGIRMGGCQLGEEQVCLFKSVMVTN